MTLINSLSTTNNASGVISQSEASTEQSVDEGTFGTLLDNLSSGADVVTSTLTAITDFDILPIDSFQNQLLLETGLTDSNLLSLNISDDLISEMQQQLLTSLQTSMIKTSAVTAASSAVEPLQSGEDLVDSLETEGDAVSSVLDDVYSYSFGDEGIDKYDFFDSVNVLNHIPILSDIYQVSTDTDISPVSKLAGSFLYSGPIGAGVTALEMGLNYLTGFSTKDLVASTGLFSPDDTQQVETE